MFRPEQDSTDLDLPKFRRETFDTHSGASVGERYAQSMLAYDADSRRQKSEASRLTDGILPPVQFHDSALEKLSDAPPTAPVLDENGRVEAINYADGTSRQFIYENGHLDMYKDRDGHLWKFSEPDTWTQQDGKSVLHGEMIVDKDGSFTFINHDKDYVSHYGADGKEKTDAQKKYDAYSKENLIALEAAGKQFAATGLPQDSLEKSQAAATTSPEATTEPRPQPETQQPVDTAPQAPTAEPKPQPERQGKVDESPLTPQEIAAFARNFGLDPAEVTRISALPLGLLRAEMQAMPQLERINSQKYRFYSEMVYRLTDGKTSAAYEPSNIA